MIKNDKAKPTLVLLLDADRNVIPGAHTAVNIGPAGFRLWGMNRVFWWADKGKTWLPAENEK